MGCLHRKNKPVSGSDCLIHSPENPVKRPDLGLVLKSSIRGFFGKIPCNRSPDFDPIIWVSFGFGHTLGRLVGDLPRKGPWRPANEGVGNGRFLGSVLSENDDSRDGFLRRRVISGDRGGPGDSQSSKHQNESSGNGYATKGLTACHPDISTGMKMQSGISRATHPSNWKTCTEKNCAGILVKLFFGKFSNPHKLQLICNL